MSGAAEAALCVELRAEPVVAAGLEMSEPHGGADGDGACSEDDGYESLPVHASFSTHMTAGAVAGVLEHTVMYPVDSVKVTSPQELTRTWQLLT